MSRNTLARIIGSLLALGIITAVFFLDRTSLPASIQWIVGIAIGSVVIAFLIAPYITVVPYQWIRQQIRHAAASDLLAAVIGLIIGLFIALLLGFPLENLPGIWGRLLPFVGALLFGYLGIITAVLRKNDLAYVFQTNLFVRRGRERDDDREKDRGKSHSKEHTTTALGSQEPQILLDTSTIIDGRIADISQTGFIIGTLVVPRFVLDELQHIADSADTMRRNRGRRGLEILNRLQKDDSVRIEIVDTDVEGITEVDGKLVKLARTLHCLIITNDFNLNRVAELQGVKVLNINELANAVKPALLPGEDIAIRIMQDGKELNQGVGYLDDGTMIVVEGGKQFMNSTVEVSVTRVLQTVAGRMIFAYPKQGSSTDSSSQSMPKQRPV